MVAHEQQLHPGHIRVVFRDFPLRELHPYAEEAALAAECAARDGAFNRYAATLFEHQRELGALSWARIGVLASVPDTSAIATCVRDRATQPKVDDDIAAGVRLGIKATPTLLVNGILQVGLPDSLAFDDLLQSLIVGQSR